MIEQTGDQANQGDPQDSSGQTSDKGGNQPRVYTEAEYLKVVSDEKAISGRFKADNERLTTELTATKGQLATLTADIEASKTALADVNAQLDELGKNDPEKAGLIAERRKLIKDIADKSKTLNDRETTLNQREKDIEGRYAAVQETETEIACFDISQHYEGGDAVRLKALATQFKATTPESITAIANTLWTKKAQDPVTVVSRPDSGIGVGGDQKYNEVRFDANAPSASEMIAAGLKKKT